MAAKRTLYLIRYPKLGDPYLDRRHSPLPTEKYDSTLNFNAALKLSDAPKDITTPLEYHSSPGTLRTASSRLPPTAVHSSNNCGNDHKSLALKLNFFGKKENRRLDLIIEQLNHCISARFKETSSKGYEEGHLRVIQQIEYVRDLMIDVVVPRFAFIGRIVFKYTAPDVLSNSHIMDVAVQYTDGSLDFWSVKSNNWSEETDRFIKFDKHVPAPGEESNPLQDKFEVMSENLTNGFLDNAPAFRKFGNMNRTVENAKVKDATIDAWLSSIQTYIGGINKLSPPNYINFDYLFLDKKHFMIITTQTGDNAPEFWKTSTSNPSAAKIGGKRKRRKTARKTRRIKRLF